MMPPCPGKFQLRLLHFLCSVLLLWLGVAPLSALSEEYFTRKFPNAEADNMCRLFRLDGCEVIAMVDKTTYSSSYTSMRVAAIFVRAQKREAAEACAKKLIETLGDKSACLYPFVGDEPSVAILYSNNTAYMSTVHTMLYPIRGTKVLEEISSFKGQFIGWQGKQLLMRFNLANFPAINYPSSYDPPSSRDLKLRGIIEIALDITLPELALAELKIVRFNGNKDVLRDCISEWIYGKPVLPANAYSTGKSKKRVRKMFSGYEVLVDTTDKSVSYLSSSSSSSSSSVRFSYDFSLYMKGKQYLAGNKDRVQEAAKTKRKKVVNFVFPEDESAQTAPDQKAAEDTAKNSTPSASGRRLAPAPEGPSTSVKDLKTRFPDLRGIDVSLDVMRMDNSLVYFVNRLQNVYYVLVRSSQSQEDALRTAKRLAESLPAQSRVQPFAGDDPAAVIFPPVGRTSFCRCYSDLLVSPWDANEGMTQFVDVDGVWVTARLKVDAPGVRGTVESRTRMTRIGLSEGTELKVIEGNVDIRKFLEARDAWKFNEQPSDADRERLKALLGCEDVLFYRRSEDDGNSTLIISCGNNTYRIASLNALTTYKNTGAWPKWMSTHRPFPEIDAPMEKNTPAKDSTPLKKDSTKVIDISMVDGSINLEPIATAPGSGAQTPPDSPQQARQSYLENLRKL